MMINDSINCTLWMQEFVGLYTVGIYAPLVAIYIVVAVLFLKHLNSFHPLFVISFFLILLAYTVYNFILFFRNLIEFFFIDDVTFAILEMIFTVAHYYTQPIVILALFERLAATVLVTEYEQTCHWFIYSIGQALCVIVVVFMCIYKASGVAIVNNIQIILSIIIAIVLIILFLVNKRKTELAMGRLSLTTRYQLAENIKALRIFVPFILLDNVIAIMFVVTSYVIGVGRSFDNNACRASPNYWIIFTILRTIAIVLQISMAIIVIYQHESMHFCKRVSRRNQSTDGVTTHKKVVEIRNVLGKNVAKKETAENYFAILQSQWVR
ncbi:unnamed protein product [Caenorhabditis bovis]|uniref:Uncharacterized protein n=1 Tax=Caenorhabditis bovis TaxID=2654633 RepID=A0A8S1E4Y2_9PELO|nr:unnamed protein product [Caenorhabditis bovis]